MAIRTLTSSFPLAAPPAPSGTIFRGQHDPDDVDYAGPTGIEASFLSPDWSTELAPTGNGIWIHVDGATGSDSTGDGSAGNPYKTINHAVHPDQCPGGGSTVVVTPGIYPETVQVGRSFPEWGVHQGDDPTLANPVRIVRKGTGDVIVHGGDIISDSANLVSDWAPCSNQSDAGGNANWAQMFRCTIKNSDFKAVSVAQLMEGAIPGYNAISGFGYTTTERMFARTYYNWFWQNGTDFTWVNSGGNLVITHTLLQTFASGSLVGKTALLHRSVNGNQNVAEAAISAHDAGAGTITINGFFTAGVTFNGRYAMSDDPIFISAAGQWAFDDDGTNTTIWYWPRSGTSDVRFSARASGIQADAEYVLLYGIAALGQGGDSDTYKNPIGRRRSNGTLGGCDGYHIEECRVGPNTVGGNWAGSLSTDAAKNARILNNTVEYSKEKSISVASSVGTHVRNNLIQFGGNTGLSTQSAGEFLIVDNKIVNIYAAHGNASSSYIGSYDGLFAWNIVMPWNDGDENGVIPMTFQRSSRLWYVRNLVGTGALTSGRGIEDNSSQKLDETGNVDANPQVITVPGGPGTFNILYNTLVPWVGAPATPAGQGSLYTDNQADTTSNVCGNVGYGWTSAPGAGTKGRYSGNSMVPSAGGLPTSGAATASGNISSTIAGLYADPDNLDYTPVSDALTACSDHSDLFPAGAWIPADVATWLTDGRDVHGNAMAWTMRGAIAP